MTASTIFTGGEEDVEAARGAYLPHSGADIRYAGQRRREAGVGLKHGIEIIRDVTAEDKWQRAEQRHGYSHQPDRHETLARIEIL